MRKLRLMILAPFINALKCRSLLFARHYHAQLISLSSIGPQPRHSRHVKQLVSLSSPNGWYAVVLYATESGFKSLCAHQP